MLLFPKQAQSRFFINAARGFQLALRPEDHLLVSCLPREANALIYEAFANAEPSRRRLYQQKAQLGGLLGLADQKNRSDALAILFGNPASFALRIISFHKLCHDSRNQGLEALVVSVLLGIKHAVAIDHPTDVTRQVCAQ